MTRMDPSPPTTSFYRSFASSSVTLSEVMRERTHNVKKFCGLVAALHPVVQGALRENRRRMWDQTSNGKLPNFTEGDFFLSTRENLIADAKHFFRWCGPRRVVRKVHDYVYQVEDLRNGCLEYVHTSRLKFYQDSCLESEAVMPHVLTPGTGMEVQRLMRLLENKDGLIIYVCWRGLSDSDDTVQPIKTVYEDIPILLLKLLRRKKTTKHLVEKARREHKH